jgi:hypothetical protein
MTIPHTYTDVNETGCCAVPDIESWDRQVIHFDEKPFIRMTTRSVLHVPLNMASVMTAIQKAAEVAGASMPPADVMCLSHYLSPWRAEQLFAVSRPVEGVENVVLTGDFAARVVEGPFSDAHAWADAACDYAAEVGRKPKDVYFFYTTCPACASHYRKNYVIALARLEEEVVLVGG